MLYTRLPVALISTAFVGALLGCGNKSPAPPNSAADKDASAAAIAALQKGELDATVQAAQAVLDSSPSNAHAAGARGLARWVLIADALMPELGKVIDSATPATGFNHARTRAALEAALKSLGEVRADFAIAAKDPGFAMQVCLACWERDWNFSGQVDDRDRFFLAIERGRDGKLLQDDDPRVRPTYDFDVGDAHWAHAMASFQAAALEIVLAFDGTDLDKVLSSGPSDINIPLKDAARIQRAHKLILEGLDSSDAARVAYLAETDNAIEWVPNPNQTNYPMPLEVDASLYGAWEGIIGDVRDLLNGKTGISVGELSMLEPNLPGMTRPTGYLDVGRMFKEPRSIKIRVADIESSIRDGQASGQINTDDVLSKLLGVYYATEMKPSPLTKRLLDMSKTIETGADTFERKLMYLLWLN